MAISNLPPYIEYTATAGQTVFPYPFKIFNAEDVDVYVNSELKELTTDYTVSGVIEFDGGNITFNSGLSLNDTVLIRRNTEVKRTTDFQQAGPFLAVAVNEELDKFTAYAQEIQATIDQKAGFAASTSNTGVDLPTPDAGKALMWNSAGDNLENSTTNFEEVISTASTHATNAGTQATNAANSATAAATSATNAATSATNAANSATAAATSATDAANTAAAITYFSTGYKNWVHNPQLNHAQRRTAWGGSSPGIVQDRWWFYGSTGIGISIASGSNLHPDFAAAASVKVTIGGAGSYIYAMQKIFDNALRILAGKTVTVSFWIKGAQPSVADLFVSIDQNFGSGGSSTVTTTSTAYSYTDVGNWTKISKSLTLPSISGKTIGNESHLRLKIDLPQKDRNDDTTYYFTGVQLELGSETPFEYRSTAIELTNCRRWFQKSIPSGIYAFTGYSGMMYTSRATAYTLTNGNVYFNPPMEKDPTVTICAPESGTPGRIRNASDGTDFSAYNVTACSTGFYVISSGGSFVADKFYMYHWFADCETSL